MKKKFKVLLGLLAFFLITYFVLFSCNISDEEAIRLSKEFCNKFGISCQGKPDIRTFPSVLPALTGGSISGVFNRHKSLQFDNRIILNVGCRGREIIGFYNSNIETEVQSKYRTVTSEGHPPIFHTHWTENISEEEAMKIIDSIAAKIGIPEDMVFDEITKETESDKINRNYNHGYWLARWVRKRDGYKYEGDRIEISIMRSTGDFVDYRKAYIGSPCPTLLNISKEKATELAWNKLRGIMGEKAWQNLRSRYSITSVEPLIIQPNVCFGRPCSYRSKQSRLAWVIKFDAEIERLPGKLPPEEGMQRMQKMMKQWEEMGEPPITADIRIDAESGKYIGGRIEKRPWR